MWCKPWIDEIKNYWTDQSIVSTCIFCDHAVIVMLLLLGDTTSVGIRLNRYWCHSISNGSCQLEGTTNGEQCICLSVCWLHSIINHAFICIVNVMYCVLSSIPWQFATLYIYSLCIWWMVQFLIIDFLQNICGCDYYIIHLLYGNHTSLHCSMLCTWRLLCVL